MNIRSFYKSSPLHSYQQFPLNFFVSKKEQKIKQNARWSCGQRKKMLWTCSKLKTFNQEQYNHKSPKFVYAIKVEYILCKWILRYQVEICTLRISIIFCKWNWSEHPVWHYDVHRSSLNSFYVLVYRCTLDIALNTHLVFLSRCANDYFDVVVLLLLLYRHLYDHMTVDSLQKVAFLILPTTTILILWSKIYDYLYFDLFLLLFCWYTNTYTIIWLAADSCFLDIAYYKHLDSVIKIYDYFDVVVIIQISIRSYYFVDFSQTSALMVTRWTAIVTLVPYSTAISGTKSIDTQLT